MFRPSTRNRYADDEDFAWPVRMHILTRRLCLRELTKHDEPAFAELLSDSRVMEFAFGQPLLPSESRLFLAECMSSYRRRDYGLWAVTSILNGAFIGYCGLTHYDELDGAEEVELGYRFLPTHWRQGFATEGAQAVVEYANDSLGLERLVALILPSNLGSIRVAEKVGMRFEKELHLWERSYCQIWCSGAESSGDLIDVCYLNSVFELHSSDYLGQVRGSA